MVRGVSATALTPRDALRDLGQEVIREGRRSPVSLPFLSALTRPLTWHIPYS